MDDPTLVSHVSTLIGTGNYGYGIGQTPPGAQWPNGAMRLSPDTSLGLEPFRINFDEFGGYWYHDTYLECFSHTHVQGAGEGDFMNFGVMISREDPNQNTNIIVEKSPIWYKSKFSHTNEVATAGYYATEIDDANTKAELTVCGPFSGMHRYTCRPDQTTGNTSRPCVWSLDLCHGVMVDMLQDGSSCKSAQMLSMSPAPTQFPLSASGEAGPTIINITATMIDFGDFAHDSPNGIPLYIFMQVEVDVSSPTTISLGMWQNNTIVTTAITDSVFYSGTTTGSLGSFFTVDASDGSTAGIVTFTVRAGISFLSADNAIANLMAESTANNKALMTFDECLSASQARWERELRKIVVSGGVANTNKTASKLYPDKDVDHLTTFYSAVYHQKSCPSRYDEHDGRYIGIDNVIRSATRTTVPVKNPDGSTSTKTFVNHRYSDYSIWDEYRSHDPLLGLLYPHLAQQIGLSMLQMYYEEQQVQLPKWVLANVETNTMVGDHSAIILADWMTKGVKYLEGQANPYSFANLTSACYKAISDQCQQNGLAATSKGYIPCDQDHNGASVTLDVALDAGALINMGRVLGISQLVNDQQLNNCAGSYKNVWGVEQLNQTYFCPRYSNGTQFCPWPLTPYFLFEEWYTEGNSAQYRWYVPHDIIGLIGLFPAGPVDFVNSLNTFFVQSEQWPLGNTLPNWAFWAGNEPSILAPFLFNFAGNQFAHLTQYWVQNVLDTYYPSGPEGIPGNDDYSTMSAFCLFGYIGLYPVASTNNYSLVVPRFDDIQLRLGGLDAVDGDEDAGIYFSPWGDGLLNGGAAPDADGNYLFLHIKAYNRPDPSETPIAYISGIKLNGALLPTPIVTHQQMIQTTPAGQPTLLEFYLTNVPTVFGDLSGSMPVHIPPPTAVNNQSPFNKNDVDNIAKAYKAHRPNGKVSKKTKKRNTRRKSF